MWLHNQCACRVKHPWVHFLTDSLCVLSRFGSALSLFSLLVVPVCWMPIMCCFCSGSSRLNDRRCFVHLDMYSHCRWVPALRGQSSWDSEEHCSDVGRSLLLLGFPTQAWRSVTCCWFTSPSFLLSSLYTSDVPCQVSCWEREICLVFSAAGVDTTPAQARFSEIVQLACCGVHVRSSPPAVSQASKGLDDGAAAASVVSSRGVCGGVVSVRITMLFPLNVMFASLRCSG